MPVIPVKAISVKKKLLSRLARQDPISKITKANRAGGMSQTAQNLLDNRRDLSSNPSTALKNI
jgi:hypothetical protein